MSRTAFSALPRFDSAGAMASHGAEAGALALEPEVQPALADDLTAGEEDVAGADVPEGDLALEDRSLETGLGDGNEGDLEVRFDAGDTRDAEPGSGLGSDPNPHHAREAEREALAGLIQEIERTARRLELEVESQVRAWVADFARALFPMLSEAFLIDELLLHLPDLLPTQGGDLVFEAGPGPSAQLRRKLAETVSDPARFRVVETPELGAARVTVNWGAGGISIDHAGLLDACLQRFETIGREEDLSDVSS